MEWKKNIKATDRARAVARQGLLFQSEDIGVPPAVLSRLARRGEIQRVCRGVYLGTGTDPHPLFEAAAFAKRIPRAVVGLLTALEYYGLTSSWSDGVWALVPRHRNPPAEPGLRVVRVRGDLLHNSIGIDRLTIHGVEMQITNPTRSVLDCWKYTRRVSPALALEALKELRASNHWDGRQTYDLARSLGLWQRLRPYLEAMG